ncbi:TPR domain-containing protein [Histoplasma capsulatum G186AR]|uniref:TPR domain-containing protein n=2 Tax=Ajellomyces capsulatus TaxID=5037 RepID=C0NA27_AJECG|nr:TPR domain-containing protein [Histoplasma capsulatum G186AR]EEH11731.1 TPR domain-containing protein [Histoplasma capsulatum G186AR]KAG5302409.1 TPR domain-containing protein [Histoplasma capsulatum]QSS72192.1 TPR domain-containing protein [Histoplasma capsulatum G186AR]
MAIPEHLPASLDLLYTSTSSSSIFRYDALRLSDKECEAVLRLPLTERICGRRAENPVSQDGIKNCRLSYIDFVCGNIDAVFRADDPATAPATRSRLLHIGIAALSAFLQSNVTGPPLAFRAPDLLIPTFLTDTNDGAPGVAQALRSLREAMVRSLTVDGEAAYKLTPNVELFCLAKAVLNHSAITPTFNGEGDVAFAAPLVAWGSRMRVNFLHQKMLSENTTTLQAAVYTDLEFLAGEILSSNPSSSRTAEERARLLIERATIHTHHGFDAKARADLERAAGETGFQYALTGKLGKRTKFQDRDISQLVVLAKSADEGHASTKESNHKEDLSALEPQTHTTAAEGARPKTLDLNDDTLLEAISFKKDEPVEAQEISMTVQDPSSLPPVLAALDPSNQPKLNALDSIILLSIASAITNTSPEHGLTREETLPYATRVLDGGSSNWQVYSQALLVRSKIEGYRSRTVERGLLQLQALVDQVIADTASDPISGADKAAEQATTFLPRPEASESAPASDRLQYIWLLNFSTRWDLEAELASRWVSLGGLRTALDIYERLQMWAEVALCYAATEREEMARMLVRKQLFNRTNPASTDDNDTFEGPELVRLPADAPRLFCILGDIDKDPAMYERAWTVSDQRYARAQRSLARHYLTTKPPSLEKAEEAYRKSLAINQLNHGAWFALGCVQLELEKYEDGVESFTRSIQLDETDAEAWSNLAAALINLPTPTIIENSKLNPPALAADEEESTPIPQRPDPHKHKREALAALKRAAKYKHTNHRIWENLLTVSASIPPPETPFRDVVYAQKRLIELRGPKEGEKAIDINILTALVNTLTSGHAFDSARTDTADTPAPAPVFPRGTLPAIILNLLDENVIPLITHSAPMWLLVAKVEAWRRKPSRALAAHEKAWRATVASCTQGAFRMGDKAKWMEVVEATERMVHEGYATFGPMDKEIEGDGVPGEDSNRGAPELVAKDWRFKSRSAVRSVQGKGKELWEGTEGWRRLKELSGEVS